LPQIVLPFQQRQNDFGQDDLKDKIIMNKMIHDIFGDHVLTHLPSETKHSFPDLNHHERINFLIILSLIILPTFI